MTKERISLIFELSAMLLSLHIGFSLASADVVCAILERTSGFDPSSVTMAPRYLKLGTVSTFLPLTLQA